MLELWVNVVVVVREADWVFRIRIVVNELCEICEDIDLQLERFSRRRGYDAFALFAVALLAIGWCRCALLRQY